MANGTIAFDTLSTSGQISGTAVSVDTDYLAYGSAKAWANVNQTSSQAIRDSFNIASIVDGGTGATRSTFTSVMGNENYSVIATCTVLNSYNDNACAQEVTTSTYDVYCSNGANAANTDNPYAQSEIFGELA
tara:strand:+ start:187 stop:582 length:396 start_codon:yes stop_codon:yes gene_type:complete